MPKQQTFGNSVIQLTFFPDVNNSMPSWTISVLCSTYHHGHAMSLPFGQNKSATLIHALDSHLQLDLHKHQWSLPETHYWMPTRCQNRSPDSETSLCTAHSRSHWTHARHLLLHKTRTPRSCNIILELHSNANAQLLSRRNPKHRRWNNQTSHPWRQQSSLLCRILPKIWRQHPSCQIQWWRTTTIYRTWEPLIEHWQIMWTNSPFSKPAE